MAKLNKQTSQAPIGKSALKITDKRVRNFEGGDASMYGKKSRLLLLAVNTLAGEDTYYQGASARDAELRSLVELVAIKDPDWMTRFLPWLRNVANIRTSSITIAIDTIKVWLDAGIPGGRALLSSVLQRADEPGEALVYAMAVFGGRRIPKPVKRGIADAALRLYSEWSLLKYDSASNPVRFADVLELTHPSTTFGPQESLFKFIIDARHKRERFNLTLLPMISTNMTVRENWGRWVDGGFRPDLPSGLLKAAGMDWQDVLSSLGSKVDKKVLWEALIPNMGYMALLRNLHNMERAGVSKQAIKAVCDRLANPDEVAKSKQFPMRFLSAYRNTVSDAFKYAIGEALDLSLSNIPTLIGSTLILIDTSGSMHTQMSDRSELKRWDAAVIFGLALAARCEDAQVVSFSDGQTGYSMYSQKRCTGNASIVFPQIKGESLLRGVARWESGGFFLGAGTDTTGAVNRHFNGQKRIIILTDEESATGNPYARIPAETLKIDINLAGYGHSHAPTETKNLIKLAGLTDSMFSMIPWLEAGIDESWPF